MVVVAAASVSSQPVGRYDKGCQEYLGCFCVQHTHIPRSDRCVCRLQASAGPAFTRVIITNLKDRVLDSLRSEHSDRVCRHLAHLYHYYLHGSQGNVADAPPAKLPGGQVRPTIRVQFIEQRQGRSEVVWSHDLREVQDDLETRYLRNKKSTLHFAYDVPDKGTVEGVLWYFPYDHDR